MSERSSKRSKTIRLLISIAILLIGIVVALLSFPIENSKYLEVINKIGLALIVSGVVSLFNEFAIKPYQEEESSKDIADKVHKKFSESPIMETGIKQVAKVRRGFADYYHWAVNDNLQELFIAGRSVLHRIDKDFKSEKRKLGSAASRFAEKIQDGAEITILFFDPRSEVIERLATEEGQSLREMLTDIKTSLMICKELYEILSNENHINPKGKLSIRVYDQIPYFAFHKENEKMIVGFYFSTTKGYQSAAFQVIGQENQEFFRGHFISIYNKSLGNNVLELNPHGGTPVMNDKLFHELMNAIEEKIGK
jgi:hypothetical protein